MRRETRRRRFFLFFFSFFSLFSRLTTTAAASLSLSPSLPLPLSPPLPQIMAALTGDAPLPPTATRLLSLAWGCLERASADAGRLPAPLRARVQRGLERTTLLTPRGAALAAERLAAKPDGAGPSAFGALPGSLAPTPRGEGGGAAEPSYLPSHDSRPSPARRRFLEGEGAGAAGAPAATAAAATAAAAAAAAAASPPPAPRRPSSAARFKALFTPPKGSRAAPAAASAAAAAASAAASAAAAAPAAPAAATAAAVAAAAAVALAPSSSPAPKRPSSAQRLKAAFSPKQKKSTGIEVSASVAYVGAVPPPPLSSHALAASPADAEGPKKQRPSSAQRLKAAFSPRKAAAAAGGGSVAGSPSKRPSSAARLHAALKIGGGVRGSTPGGKGPGAEIGTTIGAVASSPARPAYVPGSIAAALASPSQYKRFEF